MTKRGNIADAMHEAAGSTRAASQGHHDTASPVAGPANGNTAAASPAPQASRAGTKGSLPAPTAGGRAGPQGRGYAGRGAEPPVRRLQQARDRADSSPSEVGRRTASQGLLQNISLLQAGSHANSRPDTHGCVMVAGTTHRARNG